MTKISEADRKKYIKRLEGLRPMDDILMRRLFKDNIPLTEWMLRIILDNKDLEVTSVTTQSDFVQLTGMRSVILDVDATDSFGNRYDIEFQNSSSGARPERARYHSSVLDVASLKANEGFNQLHETYVIFITSEDYYKKGKAVYPIERVNLVTGENFNDRAHILYINSEYDNDDETGRLLHDLRCNDPEDMYNDIIKNDTIYYKTSETGVEKMCSVMQELINEGMELGRSEGIELGRSEGIELGRSEGIELGRTEGRAQGIQNTLSGLTDEMKAAGVSEELIRMIIGNYKSKAADTGSEKALSSKTVQQGL